MIKKTLKTDQDLPLKVPVIEAVKSQDVAALKRLIDQGGDVNEVNESNGLRLTPAMHAALRGGESAPCLELLLRAGCDVDAQDAVGATAAMYAARQGNSECLVLLIKAGADVNLKDDNGWTSAMSTAYNGKVECLKLLIQAVADVDKREEVGWTAAMCAAYRGHTQCLSLLIAEGSDLSVENDSKETALILAQNQNHQEGVEMIQAALEARTLKASLESVTNPAKNNASKSLRV